MRQMREDLGYIEADLSMLRPDDGGCKTPLWTGYPPNWWLPGNDERVYASAVVELVDVEKLPPGGRGRVRIRPFAPELWTHVRIGSALDMREGQHRVGEATVTGIVAPRPAVVHASAPEPIHR